MAEEALELEEETEELTTREIIEDAIDAQEEPDTEEPVPAAGEEEPEAEPAATRGPVRAADGRFAAPAPVEAPPVSVPEEPVARAPQAWTPAARESWGGLPAPVQQEISRREREITTKLEETAQIRSVGEGLLRAAAPYQHFISAEGSNPVQAAANMFQTAALLRTGTPAQKAQVIAGLTKDYGIDVQLLDTALSGQPMPQQQQPMRDPRVDQMLAQQEHQLRQRNQAIQHDANMEVGGFAREQEFFHDVRESMADLIEVSAKRRINLSLEDAYTQACQLDPGIRSVLQQRAQAQGAGTVQKRLRKARHAASSVTGSPAGAPPAIPGQLSRRDAILAAIDGS